MLYNFLLETEYIYCISYRKRILHEKNCAREAYGKMSKCNLNGILRHFVDHMRFPEFCFSQFPEHTVIQFI